MVSRGCGQAWEEADWGKGSTEEGHLAELASCLAMEISHRGDLVLLGVG